MAVEQFDKDLANLQKSAQLLLAQLPREGWVRSIRKTLGMSMRSFGARLGFKDPSGVTQLEHNERVGSITLQTLKRAADALDADFVYAIVPRKSLRSTLATRAREVAESRIAPVAKSMALEQQGLTKAELSRQIDELARELMTKPESLWR
ncbi:MAG TPA: mobile mystery protein A [Steroidobacteraceae bacterium]|nr:mobile mystery protein A [Steroidobacteraceae bacterium]